MLQTWHIALWMLVSADIIQEHTIEQGRQELSSCIPCYPLSTRLASMHYCKVHITVQMFAPSPGCHELCSVKQEVCRAL